MLSAGALERKITIERSTETRNEFNNPVTSWSTLAIVRAHRQNVSDSERIKAQEVGADITCRFTIRWSTDVEDVNAKDRILFDGRHFDIVAVKELGRRENIEISAKARAD